MRLNGSIASVKVLITGRDGTFRSVLGALLYLDRKGVGSSIDELFAGICTLFGRSKCELEPLGSCYGALRPTMSRSAERFCEWVGDGEMWAINFYDSWGKVPAGLLFGNVYELGNFDQCRRARHSHYHGTTSISGQHCTLMVDASVLQLPIGPIWYGVCMPGVCRPQLVGQLANEFFKTREMRVLNDPEMFCYRDEEKEFSTLAIVTIVLFSCYGFILLLATIMDLVYKWTHNVAPSNILRFSAYRNVLKIFETTPKSASKAGTMDCVNGIRALSMLWIIVNHVHDTTYGLPTVNGVMRTEYGNSYFGVLFHRLGGKAVDIFLMLSGMLVTMKILRELDRDKKLNLVQLYLHRILRIVPAFAAMILFVVAFTDLFGEGVLFKAVYQEGIEPCRTSWWKALLFFQNYVHYSEMCFPHTWYLSVDMQLYILSPLILIPLWKLGRRFSTIIILLALLSMTCVFTTFMVNEYRLNKAAPVGDGQMPNKTYFPTHTRMSVWLFGVLFGYFLHKTRSRSIKLSKLTQLIGWTLAAAIIIVTSYSLKQVYTGDYKTIPPVADAFYESLHRSFWAFLVMWIVFTCINGYGGLVDDFLSWSFWQPLAKLSYTMYLIHIWIQALVVVMLLKAPVYFSLMGVFTSICGLVGISAAASVVWSVAFEYPFFGKRFTLVKILCPTTRKIAKPETVVDDDDLSDDFTVMLGFGGQEVPNHRVGTSGTESESVAVVTVCGKCRKSSGLGMSSTLGGGTNGKKED
ncbi:conserved hypothetical protein [Culex quinquefasciatus]|uniref:Nose resistant-to-fluoxetine protein N-terminal domain-containing protein n=1 Tax=Culex quinquefasciatus TaxID=7176 RepID=B0WMA8_CULQU|nr:conserved hypothetical protein [Culex quinquefasciatus]|eukprot:XP_001849842.1 conserved hypothetical protein [Culex quinquefasciatus]